MKTTINRFAKTTVVAAFMFFAFTMSAFASPIEVSNFLVRQFKQQFQGASDVTWKTTPQYTSASFIQDGQKVSVFYNSESEFVGVSKVISVNELPKKTQQILNMRYSDHTIISAIVFADAEGKTNYYVQLENSNKQSILQADEQGFVSDFQK